MEIRPDLDKQLLTFQITDYLRRCGYISLELPVIELADLFLLKAGDRAFQSLFVFEDGKQQYTLRPEFTAQALSLYVQEGNLIPIRWQFAGKVFRKEPAKLPSEQYEIGGEIIGSQGSHIDAEVIGTALSSLQHAGFIDKRLVLGNIALIHHIIRDTIADSRVEQFILVNITALNNPEQGINYLLELYDRISFRSGNETNDLASSTSDHHVLSLNSKQIFTANVTHTGTRTQEDILSRLEYKLQRSAKRMELAAVLEILKSLCAISGPPDQAFHEIRYVLKSKVTYGTKQLIKEWEDTVLSLVGFDVLREATITIAPGLVRAWDYYTGIVFDIYDADSNTHLGGGGRYDDLAQLMGAEAKIPAIGFVLKIDNLLAAKSPSQNRTPFTLDIHYLAKDAQHAFKWATMLRDRGFAVCLIDNVNDTSPAMVSVDDNKLLIDRNAGLLTFVQEDFESLVALLQKEIDLA